MTLLTKKQELLVARLLAGSYRVYPDDAGTTHSLRNMAAKRMLNVNEPYSINRSNLTHSAFTPSSVGMRTRSTSKTEVHRSSSTENSTSA